MSYDMMWWGLQSAKERSAFDRDQDHRKGLSSGICPHHPVGVNGGADIEAVVAIAEMPSDHSLPTIPPRH